MKEITRRVLWQKSEHNAFTDLIYFQGEYWCTFREAQSHNSADGSFRLLKSRDKQGWQDMGSILIDQADLRDPKLSISPDGELVLIGTAFYSFAIPKYRQTYAWNHTTNGWSAPIAIAEQDHWLWRITWHNGKAYGIAYGVPPKDGLYWYEFSSLNHFKYRRLTEFDDCYANEHGLVFDEYHNAYCLLRRDITPAERSTGLLGKAKPPYRHWEWIDLGFRIGGPVLQWTPDNQSLLAAYRLHHDPNQWLPQWTEVAKLSLDGKILDSLALESGGDCSYPGIVVGNEGLQVVYYSSHEEHCKIYYSELELD